MTEKDKHITERPGIGEVDISLTKDQERLVKCQIMLNELNEIKPQIKEGIEEVDLEMLRRKLSTVGLHLKLVGEDRTNQDVEHIADAVQAVKEYEVKSYRGTDDELDIERVYCNIDLVTGLNPARKL